MENRRSYEEIEPYCKWQKDEYAEVLEIRLQVSLKKEQISLTINTSDVLKISGKCSADGITWFPFHKEVKLHPDCEKEKILGQISGGNLLIKMPKRVREPTHGTLMEFISALKFSVPRLCMGGKTALTLGAFASLGVVAAVVASAAYKNRLAFPVEY